MFTFFQQTKSIAILACMLLSAIQSYAQCPTISWGGGNQSFVGCTMPDYTSDPLLTSTDPCDIAATPTLPAHSSTFSGNTRGYWFTAPSSFVITSVFIPTSASFANQNIAILKFDGNTPPPIFSATTNAFTTLFLTQNNPDPGTILVNIEVHAGDVIGFLASRGTANSYSSTTPDPITIAGQSVAVTRMGMQFELASVNPQQIWSQATGSISRVEFSYTTSVSTITQSPEAGTVLSGNTSVSLKVKSSFGDSATTSFDVLPTLPSAPMIAFSSPSSNNDSISVCAGIPVTMSCPMAGVQEYLWYKNGVAVNYQNGGSGTYTVPTANGAGTDIYELSVVYTGGQCLSELSDSATVVKNAPATPVITPNGPTTFCANVPTILNTQAGLSNYVWKRSSTTVQSGASASYTPTLSGNHRVTVTDANACSANSLWTNIIVNLAPTANAGVDKSVCEGSSVQIGSSFNPSNTYTWSPSIGLSDPYFSSPTATPSGTTNYMVTVNNTTTGCTNTDMVTVTSLVVPSIPSLSSTTTPVCQGTAISMSPTAIGATSINWYRNGTLLYNKLPNFIQSVTLATPTPDAYSIKSKAANGCFSSFSNIINAHVQEAALPTITSSPVAVGSTITVCVPGGISGNASLMANSTTPSPTYSWKLAGAYISGANMSTYTATVTPSQNNKVFSVEATYPNGCVRTSVTRTVRLVTSGCVPRIGSDKDAADGIIDGQLAVVSYPNPTSGILNVDITNCEDATGKVVIYNTLGQVVVEKEIILMSGQASMTIDLNDISAGIYSLSFQTARGKHVQKIVKE